MPPQPRMWWLAQWQVLVQHNLTGWLIIHCNKSYSNQNEALLWKIAVLGMKKPPVGAGTFCLLPMLVFYIFHAENDRGSA
jgi:hypothetical protein